MLIGIAGWLPDADPDVSYSALPHWVSHNIHVAAKSGAKYANMENYMQHARGLGGSADSTFSWWDFVVSLMAENL